MSDTQKSKGLPGIIFTTGLLAGSLDIIAAFISAYFSFGSSPVRVLQFIAGGAFGVLTAMTGGWMMAVYGLVFHFIIAFAWTILFFVVYPHLKILSKSRILTAIGYGLLIWVVMNLGVLPLTKIHQGHLEIKSVILGMLILAGAIGIPVSWMAHRFYSRN